MKEKILKLLLKKEGYLSGEEISNELGVTRTAIWKNIQKLKTMGYVIDSVTNRGYKLVSQPDLIGKMSVRQYLETNEIGNEILFFDEVGSTNVMVKKMAEEGANHGLVFISERQTAGRGRRGREWISPRGNCYFSILLRPDLLAEKASMLTLVSALAVAKAIRNLTGLEAQIKWPNDIVLNGKKICGILTESSTDLEFVNYIVVGIGVNVNQKEFTEDLDEKATSLWLELSDEINRGKLIATILQEFEYYYIKFIQNLNLSFLKDEYNSLLVNVGREVKMIEKNKERICKAIGIDEDGSLLVENEKGIREAIISGEVSVRGLYSYV